MSIPGVMRDSYIGGIGSASFIPQNPKMAFEVQTSDPNDGDMPQSPTGEDKPHWFNQTDEDKMVRLSCTDNDVKVTNINKTEEYNTGYSGLSILPWEEFVFNPRVFNELFYQEKTHYITYDPEEVNVFFHGKNVMPPSFGDISENGKSWNIIVDSVNDLRKIRKWLTEKCSVFGVTLVYQEKRFGKKKRAPCLVLMDPSKGSIGDKIYTTITRAMESLNRQRRFCVEINLNGLVERWCRRVLLTKCKVIGAKLVITNGEEYSNLNGAEDIVCCVLCLPLWLLQAGVYKLHRTVVYDDFFLNFDADDLFLHGTYQDPTSQRQQIFHSTESGSVFRTRSAGQTNLSTLQELGSFKFVSVKKFKKHDSENNSDEETIDHVKEHTTTTFNELMMDRKNKVISKEMKINKKNAKSTYPKTVDKDETVPKCIEATGGITMAYHENNLLHTGDGPGSATNDAYEVSDDENSVKLPKIPEVSSIYFDKEISDSEFTEETDEEDKTRLFSPKLRNQTSMSLNNALFDSADFETEQSTAVKPFMTQGINGVISEVESEDSENESSEDSNVNKRNGPKDDLINEMHKIEQTLQAKNDDSQFAVKDVALMTTNEKAKKQKSNKKKKRKNKPTVGKVLKDLMKTTEKTDDTVTSKDEKFQQAMNNLKKKFDPKQSLSGDPVENVQADKEEEGKTIDDVTKSINDSTTPNTENNRKDNKEGVKIYSDRSVSEQKQIKSDICEVEQFTADNSSTDGEDVEMIYQSHRAREFDSDKVSVRDTVVTEISNPRTIMSKSLNEESSETVQEVEPVKLIDKYKEGAPLNSNRNSKFNPRQLFSAPSSSPTISDTLPVKPVSQAISIEDAESSDEDIELVFASSDTPKAATNNRPTVPPIKLHFETGPAKKAKRGSKQYNSNRKYLGGSVPAPKKKSLKT